MSNMEPYIFCEPFAGMASMTYWLCRCKPPISYQGAKTGYADTIAGTVRVQAARKAQWERTVRPLPFDRVKQFLEGWAKSQAPSPEDVIQGISSGKAREVRVDCAICGGYGTVPTLAVTPEGKRTEYGARCHCVAGRRYGALPTVDQLRPTGGQVFVNPTLTQRRETGSVQSWLDFGKEAV